MTDIEQQVARVWNPDVRPTVAEAWRCYGTGAYRGAVALTWAAVCADLLGKIARLGEDGDIEATEWVRPVEQARAAGLEDAQSVKKMQNAESDVLSAAVRFELLDDTSKRELERLREDRHLCVHPSLRPFGDSYAPSAEYARAHLASALDALLTHPPTQGARVVERFKDYIRDPEFRLAEGHVQQTFYERVRPVARRHIMDVAAKHAILELDPGEPGLSAEVAAARCAECLEVLARRDRQLARDSFRKVMDRAPHLDQTTLGRAVARCGYLDLFWDVMTEELLERVRGVVDALDVPVPNPPGSRFSGESKRMDPAETRILALVGSPVAVAAIPRLTERFSTTTAAVIADVLALRLVPSLASNVSAVLQRAGSWRSAEEYTATGVVPYAGVLDLSILERALDAWASNEQCWDASGMHQLSAELFRGTAHLRPHDRELWRSFLTRVRANLGDLGEDRGPTYEPLEEALTEAGYWP